MTLIAVDCRICGERTLFSPSQWAKPCNTCRLTVRATDTNPRPSQEHPR
jgi:hypothetical protein